MPAAFVKNGEIVLNVSATATRKLTIDNEWIQFTARFNGASQEVSVPMSAVVGIFAKETGYGFAFTVRAGSGGVARVRHRAAGARHRRALERDRAGRDAAKPRGKAKARPSHLQIIK